MGNTTFFTGYAELESTLDIRGGHLHLKESYDEFSSLAVLDTQGVMSSYVISSMDITGNNGTRYSIMGKSVEIKLIQILSTCQLLKKVKTYYYYQAFRVRSSVDIGD
jgi:hypothetical protein